MSSSMPWNCVSTIDTRALESPDRPWAFVPRTNELRDGYNSITYSQLSRAIDKVAWWLDDILPSASNHETIVYQGPNDVRWAFLLFAAQKTKRSLLVLNPNNSLDADLKLISETKCQSFVIAQGHGNRFQEWLRSRQYLQSFDFPDLEFWLRDAAVKKYRYVEPSTLEEAFAIPWEIIQTSGTTGQPKRIDFTVAYQHIMYQQRQAFDNGCLEDNTMWQNFCGQKILIPFPQTWSAGIAFVCDLAIVWELIPVLFPPDAPQPIPLQMIVDALQYSDVTAAILLPFYIKQLVKSPAHLSVLRSANLDYLGYVGADVDTATLEVIQPHVQTVQPNYGCTDVGFYPTFTCAPGDVDYIGFSPRMGCVFDKTSEDVDDEVYELVLDRSNDRYQLIYFFHMHPDVQTYRTNDCFVRHPDPAKSNFWRCVGRRDDLIKNHMLTKTNASQVETMVEKIDLVRGVCFGHTEIAGDQQVSYLIIEIDRFDSHIDKANTLQTIWPRIEAVNQYLANEIKLKKENVIFATSDKPIPRLGKGTVNRRKVQEVYKEELASLSHHKLPD